MKIFEEFTEGKYSVENIEKAISQGKSLKSDVVKDKPDNDSEKLMKIVEVDPDTGEVTVLYDNDICYVDMKDIKTIE